MGIGSRTETEVALMNACFKEVALQKEIFFRRPSIGHTILILLSC